MLGRLILALVAFALVMVVIKMVIVALIIAGLIFRTKETVGLLLILGILALWRAYPVVGTAALGLLVVAAILGAFKKKKDAAATEPPKLLE